MTGLHYPKSLTDGLQAIWGEGFLSPGGPDEVARMLEGTDISGHWVLDIGCGLGGIDILLVEKHGADRVVGIDVEPQLISAAASLVNRKGLSDAIAVELVNPGPLPFDDAYFDTVFSKDALLHIRDKQALYGEVLRILKPGGTFIACDWLTDAEHGDAVPESLMGWMRANNFENVIFGTAAQAEAEMQNAGFDSIEVLDRNSWYREEIKKEEALVLHDFPRLLAAVGPEIAQQRRDSLASRGPAVRDGHLRPTHLKGRKPV